MAAVRTLQPFPFCIEPDAEAYVPMTLSQAMLIWWRVKEWRLVSASYNNGGAVTVNAGVMAQDAPPPPNETGLVCGGSRAYRSPLPDGGDYVVFNADEGARESFGEIYLALRVRFPLAEIEGTGRDFGGDDDNIQVIGSATITAGGFTLTLPLFPRFAGSSITDATIGIEAESYWPYDPNDGSGPIYDATTGRQLRAFPL